MKTSTARSTGAVVSMIGINLILAFIFNDETTWVFQIGLLIGYFIGAPVWRAIGGMAAIETYGASRKGNRNA